MDTATLEKEIKKRGLPANFLEDLMSEVGDSKEDVRELPIYNKVQKAVYNRLHGHIEDYDRRMDTILSELKRRIQGSACLIDKVLYEAGTENIMSLFREIRIVCGESH